MGLALLILLLIMAVNIPVIGDIIAWIFAFWLIIEGMYMFLGSFGRRS